MQDDGDKELDTGDASKKRKTTGLDTYQPHVDVEILENGNNETETAAQEEEHAEPSNNDEDEDSESKFVETPAARRDHVQDESEKKLDTGDASKKRETTGLDAYQPPAVLESSENDNDETDSTTFEDENADRSNNDEHEDSGSESGSNALEELINRQNRINNDKSEDSSSDYVETSAAMQDHVQDDSEEELDTGDASKKRKTTGLNQSESGKSSEEKGSDVAESSKRRKKNRVSPRKKRANVLNYKA